LSEKTYEGEIVLTKLYQAKFLSPKTDPVIKRRERKTLQISSDRDE